MKEAAPVTQLLGRWRDGDEAALAAVTPLIYEELKRLARGAFRSENRNHTLQPTALVNEAFVRLAEADVSWQDRAHFLAVAARTMRRILVDHARAKRTTKRGAGQRNLTLEEGLVMGPASDAQVLALNDCIEDLARFDPQKSDLVVLHYFGGLTFKEMAQVTGRSSSALERELRTARAWLQQELSRQ